jgi:LysM repeat protein
MLKVKNAWYPLAMAGLLAGCTLSYSTPPTGSAAASTSGLSSTSGPVATMNALRTAFIQQTAEARGQSGTVATNTPSSFSTVAVTPTSGQSTQGVNTPTVPTQAATVPVVATSTPGFPDTYTIHEGETVYCLGRRFNIAPNDILVLNALGANSNVYPGDVLKIPKNGDPFPGDRALHAHSANMTFTVQAPNDTIYKIACYFGDVDPNRIIAANNLKEPYTLTPGQKIIIP